MQDLKCGLITPWNFLRQMSFHENNLCDNFLLFENINKHEEEDSDEVELNQQEISDSTLCILCFNKPRNCVLQPCNHLIICTTCYGKLKRTDNTHLDREAILTATEVDALAIEARSVAATQVHWDEREENMEPPKCPYCNGIIENTIQIYLT